MRKTLACKFFKKNFKKGKFSPSKISERIKTKTNLEYDRISLEERIYWG